MNSAHAYQGHILGEDTETPAIDGKAATASIAMYLYKAGKYEQWCFEWKKDPYEYWRATYGQDYAAMKAKNPVQQRFKDAAAQRASVQASKSRKQKSSLFGMFK